MRDVDERRVDGAVKVGDSKTESHGKDGDPERVDQISAALLHELAESFVLGHEARRVVKVPSPVGAREVGLDEVVEKKLGLW